MMKYIIMVLMSCVVSFAQPNGMMFQVTNAQFSDGNLRLTTVFRISSIAYVGMETELLKIGSTNIQTTGATIHLRTNSITNRGAGGTYFFGSGFWGRNILGEMGRIGGGVRLGITQRMGFHVSLERTWKNFEYFDRNYTDENVNISYGLTFGF